MSWLQKWQPTLPAVDVNGTSKPSIAQPVARASANRERRSRGSVRSATAFRTTCSPMVFASIDAPNHGPSRPAAPAAAQPATIKSDEIVPVCAVTRVVRRARSKTLTACEAMTASRKPAVTAVSRRTVNVSSGY